MNQIENSVTKILTHFNESDVAFGVMRNYEYLPNIGHDLDLAVFSCDILKIQDFLIQVAKQESWDLVAKLSYRKSSVKSRHIDVYRFYNLKKLECLHIDFIHGMTSHGFEILSEQDLMRFLKKNGWFTTISSENENLIRFLQLGTLYKGKKTKKIKKYLNKLQMLSKEDLVALKNKLNDKLGGNSEEGLESLIKEEMDNAVKIIYRSKLKILGKTFLLNPLSSIKNFLIRLYEIFYQTFINNAGLKIYVEIRGDIELHKKIEKVAKDLTKGTIFNDSLIEKKPSNHLSYRQLKFRKEYGLLIQYGHKNLIFPNIFYDLVISYDELNQLNDYELSRLIVDRMLKQQNVLFKSM